MAPTLPIRTLVSVMISMELATMAPLEGCHVVCDIAHDGTQLIRVKNESTES